MKKLLFCLLLFPLFSLNANLVIQAESRTFDGKTDTQLADYSGSSFDDFTNKISNFLQIEFSLAKEMLSSTVLLRWANAKNDNRAMSFTVSGELQATLTMDENNGYQCAGSI